MRIVYAENDDPLPDTFWVKKIGKNKPRIGEIVDIVYCTKLLGQGMVDFVTDGQYLVTKLIEDEERNRRIRALVKTGITQKQAGRMFGLNKDTIGRIVRSER